MKNLLSSALCLLVLSACQPQTQTSESQQSELSIVATSHPLMLIAKELTQGIDELSSVGGSGDSHDTALTPGELKRIKEADLVLWLGADAQPSLNHALNQQKTVGPEQWVELPNSREHAGEKDPHFWFSSAQVARYAQGLSQKLSELNPAQAQAYADNLARFVRQLNQLNDQAPDMSGDKYVALIDVYQSLEEQTGITFDGSLAQHDQPIKLSRIQQVVSSDANCVLASHQQRPQALDGFNWIVINELMSDADEYTDGLSQALSKIRGCR